MEQLVLKSGRFQLAATYSSPKGDAPFPLLIILHGWKSNMNRRTYSEPERIALEKGYAVARLDFKGHGTSDGELWDCNIVSATDDLRVLIEELIQQYKREVEFSKMTVLASSFAGEVALNYLMHSGKAHKLILVSPGLGKGLSRTRKNTSRKYYWDNIPEFTGITYANYKQGLSEIEAPVTIIHGDADIKVPLEQSYELKKLLGTNAKLRILKGVGHRPKDEAEFQRRLALIEESL